MSYIVPGEIPTKCNNCPFGHCNYSFPLGGRTISKVDGKMNESGTQGYVCNLDYQKNGRYTMVMRADIHDDITPIMCPLRRLPEKDNKSYFPDEYADGFASGWNHCIDEIEKHSLLENGGKET